MTGQAEGGAVPGEEISDLLSHGERDLDGCETENDYNRKKATNFLPQVTQQFEIKTNLLIYLSVYCLCEQKKFVPIEPIYYYVNDLLDQ